MMEESKPIQEEKKENDVLQPVIDLGSTTIQSKRGTIHCLTIIGQIEGHTVLPDNTKTTKYEHVVPLLAALEENDDIDGVLFLINTVGGDVEAGLAIAELIAGMKKPTVSLVLGGGHSIGVPLAVAARHSFIAPSASMTIHPVRAGGTMIAAPQTVHYFERLQKSIVRFVTMHSSISEHTFECLLFDTADIASDVGSILYGQEAVECGLIEQVGSLSDALDMLFRMVKEKEKGER